MKKPDQIGVATPIPKAALNKVAPKARYVGSPEHKDKAWWGGLPEARARRGGKIVRPKKQLTTICPLHSKKDQKVATKWVRSAIENGQSKCGPSDKKFPKHVWYRDDEDQVWCGRCINRDLGEYKGWPISEDERREIFG